MPTQWFGTSALIEQPAEYNVEADGVVTITRRWAGTLVQCAGGQHKVRSPMPLFINVINSYNPFSGVMALCVSSRIYQDKGEKYYLEEVYQGTLYLPFSIYQWQTQRLDRPIPMHPRFSKTYNSQPVMTYGVDWVFDIRNPGIWNGFPNYTVKTYPKDSSDSTLYTLNVPTATDGTGGTPNKYRGIESYFVPSGIWQKTSFTLNPTLTGKLWYLDPPAFDSTVPASLTAVLPDGQNAGSQWIKSREDVQNLYRGASQIWQIDEAWWWNSLGWVPEIYDKAGTP